MKTITELKAIAFDKYMEAAEREDACTDMRITAIVLSTILSAEKALDLKSQPRKPQRDNCSGD